MSKVEDLWAQNGYRRDDRPPIAITIGRLIGLVAGSLIFTAGLGAILAFGWWAFTGMCDLLGCDA